MEIINLGSTLFNNYLLRFDSGAILIDAGFKVDYKTFCAKLAKKGVAITELKYIVLTHVHNDHISYLEELLNNTSIIPIMHSKAKERLLLGKNVLGDNSTILSRILSILSKVTGQSNAPFPKIEINDNAILCDNDSGFLKEKGFPLSIITLSGHTPDSIAILTDTGELFCGDMFINGFPALYRFTYLIESLEEYQKSWQKAIALPCKTVYPSHGKTFPHTDISKYQPKANNIKLRQNI